MPTTSAATLPPTTAPVRSPLLTILAAWLVPGSGHFLLGRRGRGAIILATVAIMFALGLLLHGSMFSPGGPTFEVNGRGALVTTAQVASQGDVLSRFIQYVGFLGDLANGVFYIAASLFGYAPPDMAGHSPDYGSKFLVGAGLLNIMAIVDAYEIATRQKD
jgi:TM2 domain-containing membrane protein YozV